MPSIDLTSYRKDTLHPQRWGYQLRGGAHPSSIIIHTTSNLNSNTSFAKEAEFIRDSSAISAHFLIGKDGRIVQFLDPMRWQAWHAGMTLPAFDNAHSIGIEHHVSVGEKWTAAQHDACTWLVRELMRRYDIPPEMVETHRKVARPNGRKSDPAGWPDPEFYAWRATLSLVSTMPPPEDKFAAWGDIGKPTGAAMDWAIPRAWLMNKILGRCVAAERYSDSGAYSVAEFERGIIYYLAKKKSAEVVLF